MGDKKKAKKEKSQDDWVGAGFKRLDPKLLEVNAPKIDYGMIFKNEWGDPKKISYLKSLAETMNQAAALVQVERDKLNTLCIMKEGQLVKLSASVEANNSMLQQEVTRMNAQRQGYNGELERLNLLVRKLEKSLKDREAKEAEATKG